MTDKRLFRLIKDLNNDDASKRRLSAEELAFADERAIYHLIKALQDDNPGVQDAAIRSLISIGGDVTAYMVVPLLRDESPFIRNSAVVILRSLGQVSIPFLYSLLKDKDDDVRKFALDILGDIRHGVSLEEILPLLKDLNPNVRASAARTAGRLGYSEAVPYLVEVLKDEEWVAFSAIEALGEIGDKNALAVLSNVLSSGTESLRFAAIDAIGVIGSEDAKDLLAWHFKSSDGIEREMTIKSLLKLNFVPEDNGVADLILRLFKESEWEDRLLYLKGLAMLNYREAIPIIIDLAGSMDPSMPESENILFEVKNRIIEFGCSDAVIDVIKDPDFKFRGKVIAIEVAGELRCKKAIPFLIELLKTDLRDVRRASIRAIGDMGDEYVTDTLIEATDDYDSHVRKSAIVALGKMGAKEAFEPIYHALSNELYEDVIYEAVKALLNIDRDRLLSNVNNLRPDLIYMINRIAGDQL